MGALEATPYENLPLGFRFKPTDVELIDHYLRLKINGNENQVACIKEVDICRVEPWDLPDLSAIKTNDSEWFYFCPRDRKYPNGQRSNRATDAGYWKATGKDRTIKSRKLGVIGMKKTLVFYTGRAPKGQRTNWVIHEYRTTLKELDGSKPGQGAFVLCRLFNKDEEVKQDDNDDGSHIDEVDTNICSPNPTNNTHEDVQSGPALVQASPVSVDQKVMIGHAVKTSNSLTSETIFVDHHQNNEVMTPEVDSHTTGGIQFHENSPDLYIEWQDIPADMSDIFPPEIGNDYNNGFNLQDINGGRDPISYYLDSVIKNPDSSISKNPNLKGDTIDENDIWNYSSIKANGFCGGFDVKAVQQQHNMDYNYLINNDTNIIESKGKTDLLQNNLSANDDEIFSDAALEQFCLQDSINHIPPLSGTFLEAERGAQIVGNNRIKIRSHIRSLQFPTENPIIQGTAERRIHLERAKNPEPSFPEEVTDPFYENFISLDDLGEKTEGGREIKVRTHLHRSRPSASELVEHGTARRRIRLQKVTEKRDLCDEILDDDSDWSSGVESVLVKRSESSMRMVVKVVMVVFLLMACFGVLIVRNVCLALS